MTTYHRPGRRHWLGQTGHREVEAGGEQPPSESVPVQKAWTGTLVLVWRPGNEQRAGIMPSLRGFMCGVHSMYISYRRHLNEPTD